VAKLSKEKISPSGKNNYFRPIVLFLDWIESSPVNVEALDGAQLTLRRTDSIRKSIKLWEGLIHRHQEAAVDAGIRRNRLEPLERRNEWMPLVLIVNGTLDRTIPILTRLSASTVIDRTNSIIYIHLLMTSLMVSRPCRPATYYSAYVCHIRFDASSILTFVLML
jgi:hypothetical protein